MTRRYPAYRDSGVEWVGPIPDGWTTLPAYAVGFERNEPNAGMKEENLLSLSYGRIVPKDIEGLDGLLPESFETYQIVHPGDIVLRLTDLQNDKRSLRSAIVTERGIITSAYLAFAPNKIDSRYLSFLLRDYDLRKVFYSMGGGLRQGMKYADIRRLPLILPSLPEQTAIAAFLDRETAKIDALVAEQRRLIDLLREKRQAVISHAVTRGLNPTAKLKPSGVDWLGDVPEGWEVVRLRFLSRIETGSSDTQDADATAAYPFFVRSETIERIGHFTHDCEAVMTSGDGAGVGKIFHHFRGKFSAHQRVYIFTDFIGVSGEFFFNYLKANFFKVALEGGAKSTVDSLRRPLIANFWMTLPPTDEQTEIVNFIKSTDEQFTELANAAEAAITLLQERRAALISAAVTGKIDVREQRPATDAQPDPQVTRMAVAAAIMARFSPMPTFGRVKNQKLIYLSEAFAGVTEFGGTYIREAAGPLDRTMLDQIETDLTQAGMITVTQPQGVGTTVTYQFMGNAAAVRTTLMANLGTRLERFDWLLDTVAHLNTRATEAVTTLFAAWNDMLIEGRNPTEDDVVREVLENWHPEKAHKFTSADLRTWLGWMKRQKIVPEGTGPKTSTGRLFI